MNQPQPGSYEHIALAAIRPSTTNPRKHFDPAALEELTQSVREMGVTEPITVRPLSFYVVVDRGTFVRYGMLRSDRGSLKIGDINWSKGTNDARVVTFDSGTEEENRSAAEEWVSQKNAESGNFKYELVAGERRYRASVAAGRTEIPAIIKELTDEQARDQQLVENLQRADLHPIEEAEGYRALMAAGTVSLEDVARKAGKTMGYVVQRMKLLNLELPAKKLFHAGHLTLGHALHLARLTPVDQDRATRELTGMNHLPKSADMLAKVTELANSHRERGNAWRLVNRTEAELRSWISTHVLLSLDKVPWSLEDALLVPEAGACTTCPKRTGSNAALFADLTAEQDVCMDPICFATKQKAVQTVAIQAAAEQGAPLIKLSAKGSHQPLPDDLPAKTVVRQGQWMKAKARSCESVRKGILTDQPSTYDAALQGMKAGEVFTVCADQACKVHKHTVDRKSPGVGGSHSTPARTQGNDAEYTKREAPIRNAIIREIQTESTPGIYEVRSTIFAQIRNYAAVCRELKLPFKDEPEDRWGANENAQPVLQQEIEGADVERLGFIVLLDALERLRDPQPWLSPAEDRKKLWAIAEHYDVDADAIATAIEAEAETKKPKPETKPAKAGTKKVSAETQAERKKLAAKKFPSKAKKKAKVLTKAQRATMAASFNKALAERQKKVVPLDGKQKAAGERAEAGVA